MSASLPTVSVLVLNLNGRAYLDACLASLEAQVYPGDRFEVVVVDNGSTDGSLEFVRAAHPRVRIVKFASNRGFCAPYNAAIRDCGSQFVALLNNDTRVAPDWLAELVSAAQRHSAAAVAAKILSWNGEAIDFAGGVISFIGHSWQARFRRAGDTLVRRETAACRLRRIRAVRPHGVHRRWRLRRGVFSPTSRMSISAGG